MGLLLALLLCRLPGEAQGADEAKLQQYSEEAQSALASGHFDDAVADYRAMLQMRPDLAEIHITLGAIFFQERRYEQAVAELRTALKLKPGLQKAEPLLSMSLAETGHYREALPGLESGFRQSADPQVKRMCGLQLLRAYTRLNENEKAAAFALELDRLYPQDPEILYHTGQVYGNLAFVNMRELAAVAPDSVWRHMAAAEAYESQGEYPRAIDEYRKVLAIDPKRPNVHYRLGRTLLARSEATLAPADIAAARQQFLLELQIDPEDANAAYEIAEIDRRANRLDAAEKYFQIAIGSYPEFEDAQLGLAATLLSLNEPKRALPHLEKAVALNPADEVAWYRLSQADRALGDAAGQKKALAAFLRLHRSQPNSGDAANKLTSANEVTRQQLDAGAPR
jgi:tetratricopeptide (TPR) repeat protein